MQVLFYKVWSSISLEPSQNLCLHIESNLLPPWFNESSSLTLEIHSHNTRSASNVTVINCIDQKSLNQVWQYGPKRKTCSANKCTIPLYGYFHIASSLCIQGKFGCSWCKHWYAITDISILHYSGDSVSITKQHLTMARVQNATKTIH